jgi:hypothetical protein
MLQNRRIPPIGTLARASHRAPAFEQGSSVRVELDGVREPEEVIE